MLNLFGLKTESSYLKFTQNEHLQRDLLATGTSFLVEASPSDRIWGVGMKESNPNIHNEANWKGMNLLGKIMTEVRERIKEENKET